jgi:hypothetical protein
VTGKVGGRLLFEARLRVQVVHLERVVVAVQAVQEELESIL